MTLLNQSSGYLLRSAQTGQGRGSRTPLNILVSQGQTQLFDRVRKSLLAHDVIVTQMDSMPDSFKPAANEQIIAIVSLTTEAKERGRFQRLVPPVLWVDEISPGIETEHVRGRGVLAHDFTDVELWALLENLYVPPPEPGQPEQATQPAQKEQQVNGTVVVAQSVQMTNLLEEVATFASSDQNVLIQGETGVGKELIARLVHQGHRRFSAGPFVAVNCGAIPEGLFESLFFGHVKGAFTGAVNAHKGYLEQANSGTLFLDEIGDLPLFQQVKLLRVLESSIITRIGSEAPVQLNFRLVTATNRKLRDLVKEGAFRADLFYRLAVIEFAVPNLEQRGAADKVAIFNSILLQIIRKPAGINSVGATDIPSWLIEQVAEMNFPGNVRQLRNLAERIGVIYQQTGKWAPKLILNALGLAREMEIQANATPARVPESAQRAQIIFMLDQNGWQRQKTATKLGISRKSLWEKMRKFGIDDAATEPAPNAD